MLAEPVVSWAVERIGNWLLEEVRVHSTGVRSDVEGIRRDLSRMKSILKDADAKYREGVTVHNFVLEIQDIAYDAEDVVEFYVLKVAFKRERRGGNYIRHFFIRYACNIFNNYKVGSDIRDIKIRISEVSENLQSCGIRLIPEGVQGSTSAQHQRQQLLRRTYSYVKEEDPVGLEEVVKDLVARLVNEDRDEYSVCICGMGGLGKTTLAQKVYNNNDVKRHFEGLAWACISQQFQKEDVLQGILIKLIPEKEEQIRRMKDEELVRLLRQVQHDRKCLIVVDDIWRVEDWKILSSAFSIGKTGRTKILLTTRNQHVALHVNPRGFIYEPPFLTEDEAWELLQKKAFRSTDATSSGCADIRDEEKMEELGRRMVRHCGGLPLAVIVLGGILATKLTAREWEDVHRNINSYISKGTNVGEEQHEGVSQVLALSYDELPSHLKQCFLYLASFPEDSEIKLEKLYQLWVAEGMVLSDDEVGQEETKMDVAECYLNALARRYMVQLRVDETLYERTEYCTLHDKMRDVGQLRSKEENFLNVIDFGHKKGESSCSSSSLSNRKVRRLGINLGKEDEDEDELVSKFECVIATQKQHLRSLLLFKGHGREALPRIMKSKLKELKVLRVVDLEGVQLVGKLPKAIGELIHLRYLNLRGCELDGKLPSSIGNLRCLQTLDLRGNYFLIIPNVLRKIKSLTHLYLLHDEHYIQINREMMIRLDGLRKLEILETFISRCWDVKDLLKLTNLRKLRACIGEDAKKADDDVVAGFINYVSSTDNGLRHSSIRIFYNFESEEDLNLLTRLLECRHLKTLELTGSIGGGKLPAAHHFSSSLTRLELSFSRLKEDPMATLEKLPNLISLVLWYHAFDGVEMVCSEKGFPQLKFLRLQALSNLEEWRVDEGAMPNLSQLYLQECSRLKMVPDGLRFLNTLQDLYIAYMPKAFVRRLQVLDGEEGADHYKIQHIPHIDLDWI